MSQSVTRVHTWFHVCTGLEWIMVVCKLKDISRLLIRIEVIKIDVALCHGRTSLRPPKFTLCVREMCLRFGEKPFRTTRIVAWLSSCTLIFTVRLSSTSHKANAGIPSVKTECARLVTSDSLVGARGGSLPFAKPCSREMWLWSL